jgi:hypothetical protein
MAELLYNIRAYEDTAANWATDTKIYPANSLLLESDTGILKKGDGINAYADLASVGAKQVAKVADITDFPTTMPPSAHDHAVADITDFPATMPPSAHDHAVVADATSDLAEASTIQELAVALSTRIKALEDLASTP